MALEYLVRVPPTSALPDYTPLDNTSFSVLRNDNSVALDVSEYNSGTGRWRWQPTAGANNVLNGILETPQFSAPLLTLFPGFDVGNQAIDILMGVSTWPSVGGERWGVYVGVADTNDDGLCMGPYDAASDLAVFALSDRATSPSTNLLTNVQNLAAVPKTCRIILYFDTQTVRGQFFWDAGLGTEFQCGSDNSDDPVDTTLANVSFRTGLMHPNTGAAPGNHLWEYTLAVRVIPISAVLPSAS